MRKFTLCLLTLLFAVIGYASIPDSLTQLIATQGGEEKFNTQLVLVNHYFETDDIESAQSQLNQMAKSDFANQKLGKTQLLILEGRVYEQKFDRENAMKKYFESLETAQNINNEKSIALAQLHIGKIHVAENDTDQALEYLENAHEKAINIKDAMLMAATKKELGNLFLKKKVIGSAQQYLSESINLYANNGNLKEAAQLASDFGVALRDGSYYESALVYQRMAMDLHRSLNQPERLGFDFLEITQTLLETDEQEEAMINVQQGLNIFKSVDNKEGIAAANLAIAEIFFKTNRTAKGNAHLKTAEETTTLLPSGEKKVAFLKKIADFYGESGDYKKSYAVQNAFIAEKNIWESKEKSNKLAELSTRFESKFKAKEQQAQIAVLETEKQAEAKVKWMWIGLFFLAFGIAGSLWKMYKTKQEDNLLLKSKNEEIEEKKAELQEKNSSLDLVNNRLLDEISEREYLEKSSFERDRFLATMTHRMGTPLNSIVGLTHLLMDDNPQPEQREKLKTLQFAANSLVVFINDVLDFSKIEAGKLKPDATNFKPKKLFNDLREQAVMEAEDKGIDILFDYEKNIPETLTGDPARLNQILTNLVSTSMKLTASGRVDVKFEMEEETEDDLMLKVEIYDTGKALDADVVRKIFQAPDEYYLLGKKNGIAFAMTMARRLIELQKGNFELFVNEEHGNLFRFWLPFKKAEIDPNQKTTLSQRLEGNKILVVEDNIINQMVVTNMLRKLKMEVVTANHGLDALDRISEYNFDLILMDIQMPEMDGYRATAAIRKLSDPVKRDVPIIALTASAFLTHEDKAKLFGMNEHVGKPFSPDELLEKIDKLLKIHSRKER